MYLGEIVILTTGLYSSCSQSSYRLTFLHVCQICLQANDCETSWQCYIPYWTWLSWVLEHCTSGNILNWGRHCLSCQLESPLLNSVSLLCWIWSSFVSVLVGGADEIDIKAMMSLMTIHAYACATWWWLHSRANNLKILHLDFWSLLRGTVTVVAMTSLFNMHTVPHAHAHCTVLQSMHGMGHGVKGFQATFTSLATWLSYAMQ